MSQAGVAYVTVKPDWQGFQREFNRSAPRNIAPAMTKVGAQMSAQAGRQFLAAGQRGAAMFARGASTGAKIAAAGITASLVGAVKVAGDFEQQISSLGAVADASARQMETLRKSALKAGKDTAFSAREAAQAQTELAKGGLAVRDILGGGLDGALALAAAGQLDLASAAEATVNAMKLFRIQGKDAVSVADAFATAANVTTADVGDFALALKQGGSAAKAAGLSFTQTTAALEALAELGIKGSDAGTSLKAALTQLASPTKKSSELMDKLGLRFFDADGNMRSLTSVSKMLRDRLGGLTREQRLSAATTLVGTDGMRALLALYDAGPDKLRAFERGLQKQGTAAEVAKQKQDNLKGSLEQLGGSFETLGINVGTLMIPAIRRGAGALEKFGDQLSEIAERDDLDIGEKLQKSLEVAKADARPWVRRAEKSVIDADLPGRIAGVLDRGTERIGEGFHGNDFAAQFVDQLRDADLPGRIGELVSEAAPKIAEAAGKAAVTAAGSFGRAFISADGWGKLALAAWLLPKMGGFAAFKALGSRAGAQFSAGFALTGALPAGVGAPIVAGGAGAAGRTRSQQRLATGRATYQTGRALGASTGRAAVSAAPKIIGGAAGIAGSAALATLGGPIGAGIAATAVFTYLEAEKRAKAAEKAAAAMSRAEKELTKALPDSKRWQDAANALRILGPGTFGGTIDEWDRAEDAMKRLGLSIDSKPREVQAAQRAFDQLEARFKVTRDLFKRGITISPEVTVEQAKTVQYAIERMSKGSSGSIASLRTNVKLNTRAIKLALGEDTAEGREALAANFRAATANIRRSMREGSIATKEGTAEIERLMVAALSQFGFSKKQALNIAKTGDPDANKGREGGASSVIKRARGGPIMGGRPTGDSVPALLERGEYVLNRNAVKAIGARRLDAINFGAAPRFQEGGQVGAIPDAMGALPGLDALAYVLAKKFGLGVTSGLRPGAITTSGNPSDHGWGGAIDVSNGVTTPQMDAAHAWLAKAMGPAIKQMLYRTLVGGNHFNHIHVALQAAFANSAERVLALAGAGNASATLKRVTVGGPDSALKGLVQNSLDVARAAAQSVVDDASTMAFGNLTAGSGGGSDDIAGKYGKEALKRLWISAGGPAAHANTMAAVALAESGGNPSIVNSIGAGGLWQIHPPEPGYLDPMTNARIAVRKFEERGFVPWEAYTNGSYTKFLQQGGLVSSLLRLAKGGPAKGRLPAGIDFSRALGKVKAGRSEKLRTAATEKLVARIQEIAPSTAGELARLKDQSDLFADLADRAGRLTDTGRIQDALQEELTRRQGLIPMPSPLFPPDAQQAIVDQMLGRANGHTQLEWLTSQLTSLFDWRNVITDTTPLVKQLQDDTQALLDDAKQRLERVMDQLKRAAAEYKRVEARRDRLSKREKTLQDRIKAENRKPANKRDQKKLRGWREELTETHAEHVELNQRLARMRGEERANTALKTSLEDQIIPALDDKGKSLTDTMGDLLGNLVDIQGLGGSTKRLAVMPPLEQVGGRLLDVGSLIRELTDNPPRIEATVPAASENQQRRADLLQELLTEERQRGLVREAALRTFGGAGDLPFAGSFDTGGTIPGPAGKPYAAIVHGREEILTVDDPRNQLNGGGTVQVTVIVQDGAVDPNKIRTIARDEAGNVLRTQVRVARRGLPAGGLPR